MLSALMVSAVGHVSENFFEQDVHVRDRAFVNFRHQTSSRLGGAGHVRETNRGIGPIWGVVSGRSMETSST
jgi:hypothetical protein